MFSSEAVNGEGKVEEWVALVLSTVLPTYTGVLALVLCELWCLTDSSCQLVQHLICGKHLLFSRLKNTNTTGSWIKRTTHVSPRKEKGDFESDLNPQFSVFALTQRD